MTLKDRVTRFLCTRLNDSMYHAFSPLAIVSRLMGLFYLEMDPKTGHCSVNFFQAWNILGWCLVSFFSFNGYLSNCRLVVKPVCHLMFALILIIEVIYILTEGRVKVFFKSMEDIDKILKNTEKSQSNSLKKSVQLSGYIVLHVAFAVFRTSLGSEALSPIMYLTPIYNGLFKKMTFIAVKFFCDEVGERFRRVERLWRQAMATRDACKMEHARLLYHEVHATAILLTEALGPRVFLMVLDLTLQTMWLFVSTFIFRGVTNKVIFVSIIVYDLYCLLSSITAVENMIIKVR